MSRRRLELWPLPAVPEDAIDVRRRHPGSSAAISSTACTSLQSTLAESKHLGEHLAQGERMPPATQAGAASLQGLGVSGDLARVARSDLDLRDKGRPARIDFGERIATNALLAVPPP